MWLRRSGLFLVCLYVLLLRSQRCYYFLAANFFMRSARYAVQDFRKAYSRCEKMAFLTYGTLGFALGHNSPCFLAIAIVATFWFAGILLKLFLTFLASWPMRKQGLVRGRSNMDRTADRGRRGVDSALDLIAGMDPHACGHAVQNTNENGPAENDKFTPAKAMIESYQGMLDTLGAITFY